MGGSSSSSFWPRLDCPHTASGLVPLESIYPTLSDEDNVTVSSGSVLLRQCSLPPLPAVLNRITINNGASLVFDDSNIDLHVREIYIENGGSLLIGRDTCRLFSQINITFHGSLSDSSKTDTPTGLTSKGILSYGLVEMHGKLYHPTWTRLERTADAGTNYLFLQVFLPF